MNSIDTSPLSIQIGGSHYKDFYIQPVEYIHQNAIGFLAGCIIKRVCRYNKTSGKGAEDIKKIIHEIDLLLDQINKNELHYSPYKCTSALPSPFSVFCIKNNLSVSQCGIILKVTTYNLRAYGGKDDLKEARKIAVNLLQSIGETNEQKN